MWGGVRGWGRAQLQWLWEAWKAQGWRPLSRLAAFVQTKTAWQCGQSGAKRETSNSSFDGSSKLFRRLPRSWFHQHPVICCSFNEVTAAAAGWQISRIKVGKRSRGQMERVELYWPKTQTIFLMNFCVKHTSLSLIIHSVGTVHLNQWPVAAAAQKWKKKRRPIKIISSRCWGRCIRDRNMFLLPFTSEKFISPR